MTTSALEAWQRPSITRNCRKSPRDLSRCCWSQCLIACLDRAFRNPRPDLTWQKSALPRRGPHHNSIPAYRIPISSYWP